MRWADDISEEIKQKRHQQITELQDGIDAIHQQKMLDTEVEVLVEKSSQKTASWLTRRSTFLEEGRFFR